jgi:hypothetical protein
MDSHHLLRLLSVGRILVGASLTLAPKRFGRGWFGDAVDSPATRTAIRALGIRDLALGAITFRALERGDDLQELLALGAACDTVDALATARSLPALPKAGALVTIGVASSATVVGLLCRQELAAAPSRG